MYQLKKNRNFLNDEKELDFIFSDHEFYEGVNKGLDAIQFSDRRLHSVINKTRNLFIKFPYSSWNIRLLKRLTKLLVILAVKTR